MKIAILGTGFIIREALTAMSEVPEIELAAILARPHSVDKGRAFAEEFGIGKVYTDYDRLLEVKPPCSAPYVYKTPKGQRVLFQTWDWVGENYRFIQYVIRDEDSMQVSRFESEYRATKREEITELLRKYGCASVVWRMPEQTGFYQPVVLARK